VNTAAVPMDAGATAAQQHRKSVTWQDWLEQQIVHDWRPGEWDPQSLVFTGDYDNPHTAVSKCRTVSCTAGVLNHTGRLCRRCGKALRASGLDVETFVATHVPPQRNRGYIAETCKVPGGTGGCPRTAQSRGLCRSHFSQYWSYTRRHPDIDMDEWLRSRPTPLSALPPCRVPGCGQQQFAATIELCIYHHRAWQAYRRVEKLPVAVPTPVRLSWIERQTPYLTGAQFSLRPLGPTLRAEIMYVLQHRDQNLKRVNPGATRWIIDELHEHLDLRTGTWLSVDFQTLVKRWTNADLKGHVRYWDRVLRLSYDAFRGVDPLATQHLERATVSLGWRHRATGTRIDNNLVAVEQIRQRWFRQVLTAWVRHADPTTTFRDTVRACVVASDALAARPHCGEDPTALGLADIDAVVEAIRTANRLDGQPAGYQYRQTLMTRLFAVLEFGRVNGLMDSIPGGFTRQRHHQLRKDRSGDETGKAIPETVIQQLDGYLPRMGNGIAHGALAPADVDAMFQTVYIILRDTGRRPQELCTLSSDCLQVDGSDFVLVWDNHKSRRMRRRLPILRQTADAIRTWQARAEQLPIPEVSRPYLFPSITTNSRNFHMHVRSLASAIRSWVDDLPSLDSDVAGDDGVPVPFDRSLIYPYAFRHSYAQRHADAGVPVDVLRDLMDHRSVETTMGYYAISQKRKREAITTMRLTVTDRTGTPAPMSSATAYQTRAVAVPFGNCIEPSNVKAGGKGCRLRFQCAGCGFYRPDASYLPAIEDHIRSLKADREAAHAMDADEFVMRNLTDQIDAFTAIVAMIKDMLETMPPDERERIEDASRVLRKTRAAEHRKLLPLTVTRRENPTE